MLLAILLLAWLYANKPGILAKIVGIGSFMVFIGGLLNTITVGMNGGRMPVYNFYEGIESDFILHNHFLFDNFNEVAFPYLTDIIIVGKIFILSLGDIILLFGGIIGIGSLLALFVNDIVEITRRKKEIKRFVEYYKEE